MNHSTSEKTPSIRIRTAEPADNVLLADLGARTFSQAFAADNTAANMADYLARSFSPAKQAAELADPTALFLIAESATTQSATNQRSATAIGYAKLHATPPQPGLSGDNPVEIVRLYVVESWIGHGVGAALMAACLATAVARGHDAVWLGVWEHNTRAIAFYERWGFARFGEHTFELGSELQTDFLLGRQLDGSVSAGEEIA